jgi:hypothetical protein
MISSVGLRSTGPEDARNDFALLGIIALSLGVSLSATVLQSILLTRVPALTGRYEFLSFRDAAGGGAWLSAILEQVQSAAAVRASTEMDNRWVSVAFTWNGLRALSLDEDSLATFPKEFKPRRAGAQYLGTPSGARQRHEGHRTASGFS